MLDDVLNAMDSHFLTWVQEMSEGTSPFSHLPEKNLKEGYALAHALYGQKHYQEAGLFFRFLSVARPLEAKYWKGLGACFQMQKEYEHALDCYGWAEQLQGSEVDPALYVHQADCHFALNEKEAGLQALKIAEIRAKQVCHQPILTHLQLMQECWKGE